jgi:acetolactate synthase-1/3 small subunit
MSGAQVLSVVYDDGRPFTLTRAVGLLRRRNVSIRSLALGPGPADGSTQLQLVVQTDRDDAERIAMLFQKVVGVQAATTFAADRGVARELVLARLRPPGERLGELLDTLQLYRAALIDESAEAVIVELAGEEAFVCSGLRALEPFGIIEVARSGRATLERQTEATA